MSLWTAGAARDRAGLTVSSVLVAHGDPACVLGLLDPDSDLFERLEETGRAVVHLLGGGDRDLAEAFGGQAPAPGGPFRLREWAESPSGPMLSGRSRACVRLLRSEDVGWSRLVVAEIEDVVVVEDADGLEHRRGRYRRTGDS